MRIELRKSMSKEQLTEAVQEALDDIEVRLGAQEVGEMGLAIGDSGYTEYDHDDNGRPLKAVVYLDGDKSETLAEITPTYLSATGQIEKMELAIYVQGVKAFIVTSYCQYNSSNIPTDTTEKIAVA